MKKYTKDEIKAGSKYVNSGDIVLNDWNPKTKKSEEYYRVKQSVELNGQVMPIITRDCKDGVHKYEVLDGEQRFTALLELGVEQIWIVNLGEVDDKEAQAMTVWMEQAVPFDDNLLGELLLDLKGSVELPYTDEEINLIAGVFPETEAEEPEEELGSNLSKFNLTMEKSDISDVKDFYRYISDEYVDFSSGQTTTVVNYAIIKLATMPEVKDLFKTIIETKIKENNTPEDLNEENDS